MEMMEARIIRQFSSMSSFTCAERRRTKKESSQFWKENRPSKNIKICINSQKAYCIRSYIAAAY